MTATFPVVTKAAGETITADEWNTFVRDNNAVGVPDIFTAKGQLVVGTGVNAATLLPVGSDYTVIQAASAAAGGMSFMADVSASISWEPKLVPSGVATILNSAVSLGYDTNNFYNLAYPDRLTIPAVMPSTRRYLITFGGYFETGGAVVAEKQVMILKNGSTQVSGQTLYSVGSRAYHFTLSRIAMLNPGDYITIELSQWMEVSLNFRNASLAISLIR